MKITAKWYRISIVGKRRLWKNFHNLEKVFISNIFASNYVRGKSLLLHVYPTIATTSTRYSSTFLRVKSEISNVSFKAKCPTIILISGKQCFTRTWYTKITWSTYDTNESCIQLFRWLKEDLLIVNTQSNTHAEWIIRIIDLEDYVWYPLRNISAERGGENGMTSESTQSLSHIQLFRSNYEILSLSTTGFKS